MRETIIDGLGFGRGRFGSLAIDFGCSFTAFRTCLAMHWVLGCAPWQGVVRFMEGPFSVKKANPPLSIIARLFDFVTGLRKF